MIYLILIFFIQTTTFGHMISVFVESLDEYEEVEEVVEIEEIVEIRTLSHSPEEFPDIADFFIAIRQGDTYGVIESLSKNIHPNTRSLNDVVHGSTALMEATSHRRYLIVRMLLMSGSNPNLPTYSLGVSNITPLMVASQQGPFEIVQDLVNNGARIDTQTTGRVAGSTALMAAIRNQRKDIVEFLLARGANANLSTTSGEVTNVTPLMIAAQTGNIDIVKTLIQTKTVKIFASDSLGRNALVYAYMSGNIELITYLGSIGLKTDFSPTKLQEFMKL